MDGQRHLLDLDAHRDEVRGDGRQLDGEEGRGDLEGREAEEGIFREEVREEGVVDSLLGLRGLVGGGAGEAEGCDALHDGAVPGEPFDHDGDVVGQATDGLFLPLYLGRDAGEGEESGAEDVGWVRGRIEERGARDIGGSGRDGRDEVG